MSRIARRIAGTVVPVVAAVAALVAFGAPAQAAATASLAWQDGPDFAIIQLNPEAVDAVAWYNVVGQPGVDDLCNQIDGVVNAKRFDKGYATGLDLGMCVGFMKDCVAKRSNDRVQIDVYADLTYRCSTYA
ncbi:MAG TPA: hypothetical protein VHW64_14930 [Nocardioides sp.]|jgi:hypothetical protein|uniref:hypothetical protein n=1 Tax=Nocardioides sp. TaxID=35761 RepID=UPI002E30A904|nr:hypothetical protein [Nocardioides sp.]HEX3931995.1 hypothetical protein [Nocardioides sp.]